MNRRGFLAAIAGLVAGAALDPERLLWVPNRKLISIPPVVPIGNVLTPEVFSKLCLEALRRNLALGRRINAEYAAMFDHLIARAGHCGQLVRS